MSTNTSVKQRTIAEAVTLTGVGLHTGENVNMRFVPAPENHGYAFKRIDLEGEPIIEADANYVVNTQRGTNLEIVQFEEKYNKYVSELTTNSWQELQYDNLKVEIK